MVLQHKFSTEASVTVYRGYDASKLNNVYEHRDCALAIVCGPPSGSMLASACSMWNLNLHTLTDMLLPGNTYTETVCFWG